MIERAPAKINVCLFVGGTRAADGRHELVSVMQAVDLADELRLEPASEGDEVHCPGVEGPNLVADAIAAGNVVARGTNNQAAGGIHGDMSDLLGTLEADGYMPNGAVGNITLKARLRQVRDTTGQTIVNPDIPDIRFAFPGLWPSGVNSAELLVGDFTKLVVGVRQDMTYKLITDGVITDAAGVIQYNLPQQDMVAMRLVFRAAYAVSNPINYQQGVEASRFPFAVLRSPAV